jgi:acyl-CoA reductase-like NAD-dependent aldehyde dehydrogenase
MQIQHPSDQSGIFSHTIDGRAVGSDSAFEVVNPATGRPLAACPDASNALLEQAVAAARRASVDWSAKSFAERRAYLYKFAAVLRAHLDSLARLLTQEQGKPLVRAHDELTRAASQLERLSSIEVTAEVLREDGQGRVELHYRALGVVGAITPWNVPVLLAISKITQALYTGNTVVLKPSPYTPLTTLRLGELSRDIFPRGVLNVVAGGNELGRWMSEHPGIDKISFTGSVATGKRVMSSAAGNLKRLTLELGGNDPAIVLPDVDVQAIAPRLFWAAFGNSGQVCMAIKRLYVHERVYDSVCERLAALARSTRVGDGLDPGTELGPVQNRVQYERLLEILEDTRRSGARILAGGHALDRPGYFIAPTIVADIGEGTRLVDEEPFGPVLPVIRFEDIDDVVGRANATRFGLGGSVWTGDLELGARVAARLEVGTAWVNQHVGTDPLIPFGGCKESGVGREYSVLGLKGYMEARVLSVAGALRG